MTTHSTSASSRWSGPYLAVDGRPFLVVGAEVHNSSSSTPSAIADSFAAVRALGANTVLAPVAWDLFEPVEGHFDHTLVDAMIKQAQQLGMRLIPLWFGAYKNAVSTYAPGWVKTDSERFPRTQVADGQRIEQLTPFAPAARAADARAFGALMRRIHDVDTAGTVLAVQVENEMGLLGDSRDRSPLANAAFIADVPPGVIEAVATDTNMPLHQVWVDAGSRAEGAWSEVFGSGERVDEAFMAAAYAAYTEEVASAGASEHDVPLFVNAWLDHDSVLDGPVAVAGGKRPGQYPSGGPVMPVAAIWEAMAPTVDFLAPDMYIEDAEPVMAAYRARRGRLLIPELRADARGLAQMFSAIGTHQALGVSPFGVDVLRSDEPVGAALSDAYQLLRAAAVLIRQHAIAPVVGFELNAAQPSLSIDLGGSVLQVDTHSEWGPAPEYPGYGLAFEADGGVYVIGRGFWITLRGETGQEVSFLQADQYRLQGEQLVLSHRLNGDETSGGTLVPFPFAGAPLLPGRVIPTRIPDSGITHIRTYSY
ncbi:DUF5597 domain-containing protein [Kineococcus radiotolerans]|uniref:Glycoside hydrolase family 35 n=1 Tax=Kineococcus radiotolerans (strain ATCC BAA-149 / DSM 14245 / SRS30216) TaxID=266940 RepID=A6WB06_KINRD|nr:DUF5597 domain-containing protein [Kineococcus radiotolerans]ABS03995.1 glycoside hydrolase family 35 [Kineococcus radiotolerans SRS30216 = ATCC BAA-149]